MAEWPILNSRPNRESLGPKSTSNRHARSIFAGIRMTDWCHRRVCGSLFMRGATAARCFRHKWTAVKQSANRLNNQKVRSWRLNHERQTTTLHLYRQPEDADHDVS